jgi:predicted house-cleaning noncanonical NTP pyrophosphatase (MazG superfamily)
MQYNKLVRDNIPKVLDEKGVPNKYHIATDVEFEEKLFHKLLEEANDLQRQIIHLQNLQIIDLKANILWNI